MPIQVALTLAHRRRLARLARLAGCEPQEPLDDVLRFGFDFVVRDIRESSGGIAEIASGKGIPHGQIMDEAKAVVARHARKQNVPA